MKKIYEKETFFPFFSFDASNPSKESRKVSVFHSYDKKHKSHFSTTFSYWKMFVFISVLKMFVFISVFPSNYDTFNESLPLSVKQSRWFYKPIGSKGSQALGVRRLSISSIRNRGNTTSRERNCSTQGGKRRHSRVNHSRLLAGTKTDPRVADSSINGEELEAEDVLCW